METHAAASTVLDVCTQVFHLLGADTVDIVCPAISFYSLGLAVPTGCKQHRMNSHTEGQAATQDVCTIYARSPLAANNIAYIVSYT
jgi:hypothetical protein